MGDSRFSRIAPGAQELFVREVAVHGSVLTAFNTMIEQYPDQPINLRDCYNWNRNQEAQEALAKVRAEILGAAKDHPLAKNEGRIEVLCQVVAELLSDYRRARKSLDKTRFASEVRQYIEALRKETAPFDTDALRDLAPVAGLQRMLATLKPEERRALGAARLSGIDEGDSPEETGEAVVQ